MNETQTRPNTDYIDTIHRWQFRQCNPCKRMRHGWNHNDLRALPKTVRLQLLVVLSFVWSTVFTVYFFSIATMLWGWVGLVVGHLGIIFAMYFTFKQFHNQPYKREPDKNEPPMYDDIWGA